MIHCRTDRQDVVISAIVRSGLESPNEERMERERIPPPYPSNRCVRVEWAVSHFQSSIAERCVTPGLLSSSSQKQTGTP